MEASKKTGEEKMDASYHRHDISDQVWSLLEPHLPGQRGSGEESPRITADLSMRCFGYCEPERPGEICLPIMGSGAAFISGSSVGAEKVFGKNFWKF
jgi:hypothetical protein